MLQSTFLVSLAVIGTLAFCTRAGRLVEQQQARPGDHAPSSSPTAPSKHMHMHRYSRNGAVDKHAGLYDQIAGKKANVLPASLLSGLPQCDPHVLQPPPVLGERRKEDLTLAEEQRRLAREADTKGKTDDDQDDKDHDGHEEDGNEKDGDEELGSSEKTLQPLDGGAWYKDDAGHWAFEPEGCKLWRPTAAEAKHCLAGQRVVMMGDSLTRYQYTSLAYFLSAGHYQDPYDAATKSVSFFHTWTDLQSYYKGLPEMFQKVSHGAATATCNCSITSPHSASESPKPAGSSSSSPHKPVSAKSKSKAKSAGASSPAPSSSSRELNAASSSHDDKFEVWHVVLHNTTAGAGDTNAQHDGASHYVAADGPHESVQHDSTHHSTTQLDFFYIYKWPTFQAAVTEAVAWAFYEVPPVHYMHHHPDAPAPDSYDSEEEDEEDGEEGVRSDGSEDWEESSQGDEGSSPGDERPTPSAEGRQYWGARPGWRPPDVLVLNAGIMWQGETAEKGDIEEVMRAVFKYTWRLARKYGTRVIWKSVTVGRFPNELITPLAVEHGFEVVDVRAIVHAAEEQHLSFRRDGVHFVQIMYEQFNDLMLTQLCPQNNEAAV